MSCWTELKPLLAGLTHGDMIMINSNELLIVPNCLKQTARWGIYKYNIHSKECKPFIKWRPTFTSEYHKVTFDASQQMLSIYDTNGQMTMIDIDLHHFIIKQNCSIQHAYDSCIVNANGIIHLLGGSENNKHLIWSADDQQLIEIHSFKQFDDIQGAMMVYVKSKQIIVLIGGHAGSDNAYVGIWIFDLQSEQWSKIENIECYWGMSRAVITSDEKYIIIAASIDDEEGDEIYILNMDNDIYTLRRSAVHCPMPGLHHIVRTGDAIKDELLVTGYIRWLFKKSSFKDLVLPPMDVMQLITKWYNVEILHWFEWNVDDEPNQHYSISIQDILSSFE